MLHSNFREKPLAPLLTFITDGLVKSRHSRENGNPEVLQHIEKTGFPLSWE